MDNSVEALVGFVGSHGDALELLKLAKEDLDQMPPFVHLLVNDEMRCPARVLGDNDFGAAFVKIGHDGVAVEGLGGDQHVEGQSLEERWHADRVARQQFEQGVTCGSKMSGSG
jgi:hypothetical protein